MLELDFFRFPPISCVVLPLGCENSNGILYYISPSLIAPSCSNFKYSLHQNEAMSHQNLVDDVIEAISVELSMPKNELDNDELSWVELGIDPIIERTISAALQ